MNKLIEISHESFDEFLNSIDEDLGRDEESLHLFEWVIEDRYESILALNSDLFVDRPDILRLQNEQVASELNALLVYFESIEEYEKCSRLIPIINEFKKILQL